MTSRRLDLRRMDARMAEGVFELGVVDHGFARFTIPGPQRTQLPVLPYSSDVAAAWQVVEKLSHADPQIIQWGEDDGSWTWWVDFEGTNTPPSGEHLTPPGPLRHRNIATAICLAAAKYKGIDLEKVGP